MLYYSSSIFFLIQKLGIGIKTRYLDRDLDKKGFNKVNIVVTGSDPDITPNKKITSVLLRFLT